LPGSYVDLDHSLQGLYTSFGLDCTIIRIRVGGRLC